MGSLVSALAAFFVSPVLCGAPAPKTGSVSIAAAANFVYAVAALQADFQARHPGTSASVATGASGNLVAQIAHGAPYDVFLSADLAYPEALIAAGQAAPETLRRWARNRCASGFGCTCRSRGAASRRV